MTDPAAPRNLVSASGEVTVRGQSYRVTFSVPAEPVALSEMLPLYHGLAEMMISASVQDAQSQGRAVSCRQGCAACCRQLIPVTQTEARRIAGLVDAMEEPRRSEILVRFRAALEKAERAGLVGRMERIAGADEPTLRALAIDFQSANIDCPFLENERCSFYGERPLRCREYLVTSAPEHCFAFRLEALEPIRPAVSVARLLNIVETGDAAAPPSMLALLFAPDWAREHPEPPATMTGPEHVAEILDRLRGATPEKEKPRS